jgi:hypothetical protein
MNGINKVFLTKTRTDDIQEMGDRFSDYQKYVEKNVGRFPSEIVELIKSRWYYDWQNHRCPHDAWLDSIKFSIDEKSRALTIKLLGAFHDLHIVYEYFDVLDVRMSFGNNPVIEWDIDEYLLRDKNLYVHRIRWTDGSSWEVVFRGIFRISFKSLSMQ